jgi:DNA-binding helix-hairpin-helix protein with protein kinase domain
LRPKNIMQSKMKLITYHPKSPGSTLQIAINEKDTLGSGATATVYRTKFRGKPVAAKVYKREVKVDTAKLTAMLLNPPQSAWLEMEGWDHPQLAWPISMLRSKAGKDIGYLMPIVDTSLSFTIDYYYDNTLISALNSADEAALSYKLEIARNFASVAEDLHKQKHYFVDIKPQNIRVFKGTHLVSFLDCDGFSISQNGQRYGAELVSTDYISPEAYRSKMHSSNLGEEQDRYALAVLFFQLLNSGTHPFQGIVENDISTGNTNDEKAAAGLYPHGLRPNELIKPRPQSVHHLWDNRTRRLFDRAFTKSTSGRRPSAKEWANHFNYLLEEKILTGCAKVPRNVRHMRFGGKECPACYFESVSTQRPSRTRTKSRPSSQSQRKRAPSRKRTPSPIPKTNPWVNKSKDSNFGIWIILGLCLVVGIIIAVN